MFHLEDVAYVIDSLAKGKYLYRDIDPVHLETLLNLESSDYTNDQNRACAREFLLKYTNQNGVFKALAEFSGDSCVYSLPYILCKYQSLLRWHELSVSVSEDLLVCSFLAYSDISKVDSYAWPPFIGTNHEGLNRILDEEMADVHAHLIGSSMNFDVNWLCLMNHIAGREEDFKKIHKIFQNKNLIDHNKVNWRSLHQLSILASAIRIKLFTSIKGATSKLNIELKNAICSYDELEYIKLMKTVQTEAKVLRDMYGYVLDKSVFDYAVLSDNIASEKDDNYIYSVFSGERYILYETLCRIYKGNISDIDASLFYIYLLIKHKIRHELVQTNDHVGFSNFKTYQDRKTIFLDKNQDYKKLLNHLSIASFFIGHGDKRWHETRIAPQVKKAKCVKFINKINSDVYNKNFKKASENWKYAFILHFIKSPDDTEVKFYNLKVRHENKRQLVKVCTETIVDIVKGYKDEENHSQPKIVGIDAASSELDCRPEVFAHAFRYVRQFGLGITYHVGEDFYDIIDGLRAVDECIRYLDYHKYDRMGHVLVLGINVEKYYTKRHNVICMPKLVALDNAVWLYMAIKNKHWAGKACEELKTHFKNLVDELFAKCKVSLTIETYYDSWLLRGDDPFSYCVDGSFNMKDEVDIDWFNVRLVKNVDVDRARGNADARKLYYLYHYESDVKQRGEEIISFQFTKEIIRAIKFVQKKMLTKVENLKIAIECNLTSNIKIGDIDRYDEHPIRIFHSKGLDCMFGRSMSCSINTDDKGVFATSIEREYALLASALFRSLGESKASERKVIKWLDKIRKCSLDQKFIK